MANQGLKLFLILVVIVCTFYIKPTVGEDDVGLRQIIPNTQPKDVENSTVFPIPQEAADNMTTLSEIPHKTTQQFPNQDAKEVAKNQSKDISKKSVKRHNGSKINNSQTAEVQPSEEKEKEISKSVYKWEFAAGTLVIVFLLVCILFCCVDCIPDLKKPKHDPSAPEAVVTYQNEPANPQSTVQMPGGIEILGAFH